MRVCLVFAVSMFLANLGWAQNWNNKIERVPEKFPTDEIWEKSGIPFSMASSLRGVGLTLVAQWKGCGGSRYKYELEKFDVIADDDWSHFQFFVCLPQFIDVHHGKGEPLKDFAPGVWVEALKTMQLAKDYKEELLELSRRAPDKPIIISFKSHRDLFEGGERTTILNRTFEKFSAIRQAYKQVLQIFVSEFKDFPSDRLLYVLMNEPEYHLEPNGLELWTAHLTDLIDHVRRIDGTRPIIVEGIRKSLVGRGRSLDSISPIIERPMLIYGFHYYTPADLIVAREERARGLRDTDLTQAKRHMRELKKFEQDHQVPVMLTEFGPVGQWPEGSDYTVGMSFEDRAQFVETVMAETRDNGIGVTYYALSDDTTPYIRFTHGFPRGHIQPELKKEPLLWDALFAPVHKLMR